MPHLHLTYIFLVNLCRGSRYFEDIVNFWIFRLRTIYNCFQVWSLCVDSYRKKILPLCSSILQAFQLRWESKMKPSVATFCIRSFFYQRPWTEVLIPFPVRKSILNFLVKMRNIFKRSFLNRTLELKEIILFLVWMILFPDLKICYELLGKNRKHYFKTRHGLQCQTPLSF